ncbi:MAG: YkgJ family cysteine cluster protein [Phycisphaerales bacterium]|nr:MAG: YkgJ family cysteine cluster protein [Phycisphaerales bacterium]
MRLQVLDNEIRYECHSCAACCRQPWLEHVEDDKLGPVRGFNWGAKYPQLAGHDPILMAEVNGQQLPMLAKKDNGECLFLDSDNLCVIHKELGYEAKPEACRRFPFFSAPMPDADHISAHFACPSVQEGSGPSIQEQRDDILRTVPMSSPTRDTFTEVALLVGHLIPLEAAHALVDRWAGLFDPDQPGDLWARFARAIHVALQAVQTEPASLRAALAEDGFGTVQNVPPFARIDSLVDAPLPCRLLLALNLWNDYYPPQHSGARRPSWTTRMGLIGKVMHVLRMSGTYASRYLPGNVVLHRLSAPGFREATPPEDVTRLLCRWVRAAFRQRTFRRDRISMVAGLHQQIVDANCVHFYARAVADQAGREHPQPGDYHRALSIVGFGITSQVRAYQNVFRRRAMSLLESMDIGWSSLSMFCPVPLADASNRAGGAWPAEACPGASGSSRTVGARVPHSDWPGPDGPDLA